MARAKQTSQPSEEMASDVAELEASQAPTNAPSSFDPVAEPAPIDAAAYRQDIAVDIFRALVHGMRIDVRPSEAPCDVAERTLKLHAELMKHAELAGIIPAEPTAE